MWNSPSLIVKVKDAKIDVKGLHSPTRLSLRLWRTDAILHWAWILTNKGEIACTRRNTPHSNLAHFTASLSVLWIDTRLVRCPVRVLHRAAIGPLESVQIVLLHANPKVCSVAMWRVRHCRHHCLVFLGAVNTDQVSAVCLLANVIGLVKSLFVWKDLHAIVTMAKCRTRRIPAIGAVKKITTIVIGRGSRQSCLAEIGSFTCWIAVSDPVSAKTKVNWDGRFNRHMLHVRLWSAPICVASCEAFCVPLKLRPTPTWLGAWIIWSLKDSYKLDKTCIIDAYASSFVIVRITVSTYMLQLTHPENPSHAPCCPLKFIEKPLSSP